MLFAALKQIAVLVSLLPGSTPVDSPAAGLIRAGEQFAGRLMPEVRLRKLHLVRPDLIPYPIAHEVYC
jgi:hypothetical protein